MAEDEKEARATALASQALELVASGRDEDGSRALREAISLAPNNPHVKAAFAKIQSDDLQHLLHKLCSKFVVEHDEGAGKEVLSYLSRSAEVPGDVAKTCFEMLAKPGISNYPVIQDGIVAGLLREAPAARVALAEMLHNDMTTIAFGNIYKLGNASSSGMIDVLLDRAVWSKESVREDCEIDVFQLYLAKLIQMGDEENDRALYGIARLLAADMERLYKLIDKQTFDVILSALDNRNTVQVRSQATLVTAKYLEASGVDGRENLTQFITSRVAQQRNEDLVLAFSAAAGVFPVAPGPASKLFLTEGFVQGLVPLLVKKAKSEKVELAALDMLSAASVDIACLEAIKKHCTSWLQHNLSRGKKWADPATVILAKFQGLSSQSPSSKNEISGDEKNAADDLVPRLKGMMLDDPLDSNQNAIEGLAYASVRPKVKEGLAKDPEFLMRLLKNLRHSPPGSPTAFGGLVLIDNLTRYLPTISEEEKRLAQLKAYANASKSAPQADPLDQDAAVTERCKAIVNAGAISLVFVGMSKNLSPNSMHTVIKILLSISRTKSLRGIIAQQGGVRLLLQGYTLISGSSDSDMEARHFAAHALARILISVDPSLVFPSSGSMPMTSVIRPILSLLSDDSGSMTQGPRDLLPTFEALLALTNLASFPSSGVPESIIRQAYSKIEDLLLSNNVLIQRAATELVCNLVNCSLGVALFADESPAAARRMHILLAMADVEDKATRSAAAGALAVVTEFEGAVKAILARDRGMEIILGLLDDESGDRGIVHRACVCVMSAVCQESDTGKKAKEIVNRLGGVEKLNNLRIEYQGENQVMQCILQSLQALEN